MKKKNTVLFLGISSILILISVQVFIIVGVWKQKSEMFSLSYTMRSQEGFNYIRRSMSTDGFDTVRILLNDKSNQYINELKEITNQQKLDARKKEILEYFTKVINQEQDLSGLLSKYFEMRGMEKNFNHTIVINNLEIINSDTTIVYRTPSFANRKLSDRGKRQGLSEISSSKIFINWFWLEGDHYRVNIDYWIDFSDKQKVILKETSASLGLSSLSIILVGIMFMITYRNLMEERRLSNLKTDFINNMTHELKTPLSTITVAGKTLEMMMQKSLRRLSLSANRVFI
jgi:K+-sensing histidine kinase KdpD